MCSVFRQILLQQCLERTDPGTPLVSVSDHPPTFFPAGTFGISHSAVLHHLNQPISLFFFFFELKIPIIHELLDSSTYSNEVEAIIRHRVNAHLRASYTYLSLGFFFNLHNVARGCLGHFFFPQNSTGAARGSQASLQAQTSAGAVPSPS